MIILLVKAMNLNMDKKLKANSIKATSFQLLQISIMIKKSLFISIIYFINISMSYAVDYPNMNSVPGGVAIIDLADPLNPQHMTTIPLSGVTSVFQQFRFLFVTDADGLKVIDITNPRNAQLVEQNTIV